jgi:hypothetical protein
MHDTTALWERARVKSPSRTMLRSPRAGDNDGNDVVDERAGMRYAQAVERT